MAKAENRLSGTWSSATTQGMKQFLFLCLFLTTATLAASPVKLGDIAPSFRLPDSTGEQVSLGDALAKGPVVMVFYRGGWCPICMRQLRALEESRERFSSLGATIIAISRDGPEDIEKSVLRHGLNFPVLSDPQNTAAKAYGVLPEGADLAWPGTLVIASDGTIVFAEIDENYRVRPETSQVLAAVTALQAK